MGKEKNMLFYNFVTYNYFRKLADVVRTTCWALQCKEITVSHLCKLVVVDNFVTYNYFRKLADVVRTTCWALQCKEITVSHLRKLVVVDL